MSRGNPDGANPSGISYPAANRAGPFHEPGTGAEIFSRLFDRFARGPGSSGLGIGLYLASRKVAAHGGTLTADPTPTIGAKFQMKLPLADAPLSEGDGLSDGVGESVRARMIHQ